MLDMTGFDGRDPLDDYDVLQRELELFENDLTEKKQIVVANKMDIPESKVNYDRLVEKLGDEIEVIPISALTHQGTKELLYRLLEVVKSLPDPEPYEIEESLIQFEDESDFDVYFDSEDEVYVVEGGLINKIGRRTDPNNEKSMNYFQRMLREYGIIAKLEELGIEEGDTVRLLDMEFDYLP